MSLLEALGTGYDLTTNGIRATACSFTKIIRMWIDSVGVVYLSDTSKSLLSIFKFVC